MTNTNKVRLTRRGQLVVGLLATVLILTLLSIVDRVTTPAECRVPTGQMTQECLDTVFPD